MRERASNRMERLWGITWSMVAFERWIYRRKKNMI
jgi:hypothetical protein